MVAPIFCGIYEQIERQRRLWAGTSPSEVGESELSWESQFRISDTAQSTVLPDHQLRSANFSRPND